MEIQQRFALFFTFIAQLYLSVVYFSPAHWATEDRIAGAPAGSLSSRVPSSLKPCGGEENQEKGGHPSILLLRVPLVMSDESLRFMRRGATPRLFFF